jgi:sulfite reductase (ferredoxin)
MSDTRETKAQRAERLKRALNPWEAYAEIERFAREGHGAIPPEWSTYFRWWGIYSQGDGVGAIGGAGGEGKATPYFMIRVRIPNGILATPQLRTLADLSERYARSIADITVRQNVQLHWVRVEELPAVMHALWRSGLTSLGACGDVVRNVTGCPLAGVDADEIIDASPLVLEATRVLNGNAEFYNLPRKFKVSIAGCRAWCAYPEINDVGVTALRHPASGEIGFSVRVGGGLATDPHLGVRLDAFVREHQVVAVVRALAELFRDTEALRESREKARLKFLLLRHGWTAERFRADVETRAGMTLDRAPVEQPPDDAYRDHVGIHRQRQPGLCYAGVVIPRGRLTPGEMRALADVADRHASGRLRTTTMQNLVVVDVRRERVPALTAELTAAGLTLGGSAFRRGTIACTGTEFCKLALTETKGFALRLLEDLERRLPGFDEHVKVHVTGCPNSCGQHWIADIGLEGKKIKIDGALVDAYYFCLGGAVGGDQAIARPIGLRVSAPEVAGAIERLLRAYLDGRHPGEPFRRFCARRTDDDLRALLAGAPVPSVARDLAGGLLPAGVDG